MRFLIRFALKCLVGLRSESLARQRIVCICLHFWTQLKVVMCKFNLPFPYAYWGPTHLRILEDFAPTVVGQQCHGMLWRPQQRKLGGFVISAWKMCSWHLNSLFKRRRPKDCGLHSAPEMETWKSLSFVFVRLSLGQQIHFLFPVEFEKGFDG